VLRTNFPRRFSGYLLLPHQIRHDKVITHSGSPPP
jgi:hypothetical protein